MSSQILNIYKLICNGVGVLHLYNLPNSDLTFLTKKDMLGELSFNGSQMIDNDHLNLTWGFIS